jgi:hypothetical protein
MNIEKFISPFIESQFPQFYKEDGPVFIEFVKAYYEWMESTGNVGNISRSLMEIRDLDTTVISFITYFKNKYINSLPENILGNKKFLIKHIIDLYRSKGTETSYKLLFKMLFNEDIETYIPSEHIFKLSDGEWKTPRYIEISDNVHLYALIGNKIYSSSKNAFAVVENYYITSVNDKLVNVLVLTDLQGDFKYGEKILCDDLYVKRSYDAKDPKYKKKASFYGHIIYDTLHILNSEGIIEIGQNVYYQNAKIGKIISGSGEVWKLDIKAGVHDFPDHRGFYQNAVMTSSYEISNLLTTEYINYYQYSKLSENDKENYILAINLNSAPVIFGSLSSVSIVNGGLGYKVGDELEIKNSGSGGLAVVKSVTSRNGEVTFNLLSGGTGFSLDASILVDGKSTHIRKITSTNPATITTVETHGLQDSNQFRLDYIIEFDELNVLTYKYFAKVIDEYTFSIYDDIFLTSPVDGRHFCSYKQIYGISKDNPAVVTTYGENGSIIYGGPHGLYEGEKISLQSIEGMTSLNGNEYFVKPVDDLSFELYYDSDLTIPVDSSDYSEHTENTGFIFLSKILYDTVSIKKIDKENPVKITTNNDHNLANNDYIKIDSVLGKVNPGDSEVNMNEINSNVYSYYVKTSNSTVFFLYSDDNLTTSVDGTGWTKTYSSGGVIYKFPPYYSNTGYVYINTGATQDATFKIARLVNKEIYNLNVDYIRDYYNTTTDDIVEGYMLYLDVGTEEYDPPYGDTTVHDGIGGPFLSGHSIIQNPIDILSLNCDILTIGTLLANGDVLSNTALGLSDLTVVDGDESYVQVKGADIDKLETLIKQIVYITPNTTGVDSLTNSINIEGANSYLRYGDALYYTVHNHSYNISANTLGVDSIENTIKLNNANTIFNEGDYFYYIVPTNNTAISGLTGNTTYFVSFANATDFALSETSGGSNIDLTESRETSEQHNVVISSPIKGLTPNTVYYVSYSNTTSLSLSNSIGGNDIDLTEARITNPATSHSFYPLIPYTIILKASPSNTILAITGHYPIQRNLAPTAEIVQVWSNKLQVQLQSGYFYPGQIITDQTSGATAKILEPDGVERLTDWVYLGIGLLDGVLKNMDNELNILKYVRKEVGTIASLTGINPGKGYSVDPVVSIIEQLVYDLEIVEPFGAYAGTRKGFNANVSAKAGYANGVVTAIRIADSGFGYDRDQIVELNSLTNPYAVTGTTVVNNTGVGKGYWKNNKSFLSDDMYLQDSYYYQKYSCEIIAPRMLNTYEEYVKNLIHPSGILLFGRYVIKDEFTTNKAELVSSSFVTT